MSNNVTPMNNQPHLEADAKQARAVANAFKWPYKKMVEKHGASYANKWVVWGIPSALLTFLVFIGPIFDRGYTPKDVLEVFTWTVIGLVFSWVGAYFLLSIWSVSAKASEKAANAVQKKPADEGNVATVTSIDSAGDAVTDEGDQKAA